MDKYRCAMNEHKKYMGKNIYECVRNVQGRKIYKNVLRMDIRGVCVCLNVPWMDIKNIYEEK